MPRKYTKKTGSAQRSGNDTLAEAFRPVIQEVVHEILSSMAKQFLKLNAVADQEVSTPAEPEALRDIKVELPAGDKRVQKDARKLSPTPVSTVEAE